MYQRFTSILDHEQLTKTDCESCWSHGDELKDLMDDIVSQMSSLTKSLAFLKRRYSTLTHSESMKNRRRYKGDEVVIDGDMRDDLREEGTDCQ